MKDVKEHLGMFLKEGRYRFRYNAVTQREKKELMGAETEENIRNAQIFAIFLIVNFIFRMIVKCCFDVDYINTGLAFAVIGVLFLFYCEAENSEDIQDCNIKKLVYIVFWILIDIVALSYLKVELFELESCSYFIVFQMMFSAFYIGSIETSVPILILTDIAGIILLHTSPISVYKMLLYETTMLWMTILTIVIVQIKFKSFIKGKKAVFKLKNVSEIDMLTNLYNRRGMERVLEEEWGLLKDTQKRVTAILMDIDHFKSYNDTYGHIAGDKCLKEVSASILKSCQDLSEVVVRYGGEEIVAVVCEKDLKEVEALAYKIKDGVEGLKIKAGKASSFEFVTVSIGVGSIIASNENNVYSAIDRADENLYHSKFTGRNKVTVEKVSI